MTHILIVDDEELLRRSLSFNLEQSGYQVTTAGSAEDALMIVERNPPDLILLDIGLPGMDGLDALHHLHQKNNIPVIFVSARRRELDEALGLELGADDYITKPFDLNVLLARIKAVLRRVLDTDTTNKTSNQEILEIGDLMINPMGYEAELNGHSLELSPREFDLLHALALQPEVVMSVDDLLAQVWGAEYEGEPQVVYVHIRWLRKKLEADPANPQRILTVRGKGYKLMPLNIE